MEDELDAYRQQKASERQAVIRPLALSSRVSRSALLDAALRLGMSERNLRRLIEDYRNVPLLETLMPGHRCSGSRRSSLPEETLQIVARFIRWRIRCKEGKPAKEIQRRIKRVCERRNLPWPSVRTVQRYLKQLSELEKARAKLIKVDPKNLKIYPHHHDVAWPLDAVQIDHTRLDLFLNLVEFGLGKKRIWLTLAIDVASRMVFGYYLGLKAPSSRSGGLAIMMGVLPKRPWVERVGVSYEAFDACGIADPWPIVGVPAIVDSDNGADFRSYAFQSGCLQLGAKVRYRPAGGAHYGGHIERLLGTFMRKVHAVEGTSFSNTQDRKGYDPVQKCFLTLEDFEIWLVMSILEYHLTPHSGLDGLTPLQKYRELEEMRETRPDLMPDKVQVQSAFMPSISRRVRKQGVRFQNRFYYADALQSLAGTRVVVKYHPGSIDELWVCLDGITPSFPLFCIGRAAGRCRHVDALLDRMPTLALQEEAKRQQDVAERLANQRDDLLAAAKRAHRLQGAQRPATITQVPGPRSRGERPAPQVPKAPKKW